MPNSTAGGDFFVLHRLQQLVIRYINSEITVVMTENAVGHKRARSAEVASDTSIKRPALEGTHKIVTATDPEGDLKMVLDKGTLLVSRKVLTLSSNVFRAMLGKGSKFMEAGDSNRNQDGVQIIQFPEDQYETMTVVANVIHLQFDKVPKEVSFQQLYQIAILCDKYDLKRCLNHYPDMWSKPYIDSYARGEFGVGFSCL